MRARHVAAAGAAFAFLDGPAARWGARAGDTLTGIVLTSMASGQPADVMPGGWYAHGQAVPFVPDSIGEVAETGTTPPLGTTTLRGPAHLILFTTLAPTVLAAPARITLH